MMLHANVSNYSNNPAALQFQQQRGDFSPEINVEKVGGKAAKKSEDRAKETQAAHEQTMKQMMEEGGINRRNLGSDECRISRKPWLSK